MAYQELRQMAMTGDVLPVRGNLPVWFRVCSTFVQECWEAAGSQEFERTADPGDIAAACGSLHRVAHEEVTP